MRKFSRYGAAGLVVGTALAGCSSSGSPGAMTGTSSGGAGTGASSGGASPSGSSGASASGTGPGSGSVSSGTGTSGTGTSGTGTSGTGTSGTGTSGTGGSGASSGSSGGLPPGVIGHPDPTITYPTHAGYTLYLAEEFNNPIDFTTDPNWAWSDGDVPGGSVRFVQSQITFAAGNLLLTAINRPAGNDPPALSFAQNSTSVAPMAQISGEMRTTYNNYRYGWYEARYKPPTDMNGNFISTFFIFRTPQKQDWREIDIELTPTGTGSPGPGGLGTNVYFFGTPAMPNGNDGYNAAHSDGNEQVSLAGLPTPITNNQADFHVYAFEWQPTFIKWYVDGTLVRTKMATAAVPIPDQSAKIFVNLWIFGSDNAFGGNTPENNVYPLTATYDYVRFYKLNDTAMEPTYPCAPTPTCVLRADNLESKNNPNDGLTNNCINGTTATGICPD